MKKDVRNFFLSISAIVIFTVLAVVYVLKDDKEIVLELLRNITALQFICIVGCSLFYQFFVALSLYVITKEKYQKYHLIEAIRNTYIGAFFIGITPSSSGGQVGQIMVFRYYGVQSSDAAAILWLDFVMYQVVMIFYTFVLVLFKFLTFSSQVPILFIFVFIGFIMNGVVLFMLYGIVFFPEQFKNLCMKLIHVFSKLRFIKDKEKSMIKCENYLKAFTQYINVYRKNKKLMYKLVLINILRLTAFYSIPFLIGGIIQIKMNFVDSLALSSFVSMANNLFPVPGASGGAEIMFQNLYSTIMDTAHVATIMILWRFVTFHLSLIIGALCFIYEKFKRRVKA